MWPPIGPWYGTDSSWRVPLEREARRRHGPALSVIQRGRRLSYRLNGLTVAGRDEAVPVTVEFHADERLDDYGLPPADYPRVYADPGRLSKHRLLDDSLCLYNPADPPERRWRAELGLQVLLELTADHLFAEQFWRETGGLNGGEWVIDEAPHGFPAPGTTGSQTRQRPRRRK